MEHFNGRHSDEFAMSSEWLGEFLRSGALVGAGADHLVIGWGQPKRAAQAVEGQLAIFAPDFFLTNREPWFNFPHSTAIKRSELQAGLQQSGEFAMSSKTQPVEWQPLTDADFAYQFQRLQAQITKGELQKGVPYTMARGRTCTDAPFRRNLLMNALKASATLHPYGIWSESSGMLGLTPEILFTLEISSGKNSSTDESRVLSTMALAGTQSTADDAAIFIHDPKLRKEHEIVANNIVQRLAPFGTVMREPIEVLELPGLRHLLTKIQLKIDATVSADFEILAKALHPTPALGADPIEKGWSWLRDINEKTPRHRFGAPFGCQWRSAAASQCRCLVAIRNVQWQDGELEIGVGCGVVRESRLDLEWRELQLKLRTIRKLLDL